MFLRNDVAPDAVTTSRDTDSTILPAVRLTGPHLVAAGAGLAALTWIAVVLLTAGRGFDVTDEGYYLLSYRWWDTNYYTYTGSQFFYGPIFELLGHNIAGLRLFRLVTVVATHVVFGWAFMTWLRVRRPAAPASRWWEIAGTAVIVACGGMVYSWLPLSPGYNDISVLGALLAAAIALRIARGPASRPEGSGPAPLWVAALLGPLATVMLLAKWASSLLTLLVVIALIVVVAWRRGLRELVRIAAAALGGAVLSVLVIQLLVVPLTDVVPMMLTINGRVAAATNNPAMLLQFYVEKLVELGKEVVKGHWLLLLAAAFAPFARTQLLRRVALGLGVVGIGISIWRVLADDELIGGAIHLDRFPIAIGAVLAAAGVLAVASAIANRIGREPSGPGSSTPRRDVGGWLVLAVLAVLPFTQAAGTGNPVHMLAIVGLAAWVAVAIAIVTGLREAPQPARLVGAAALAGAVLITMCVAVSGLWVNPYRTGSHAQTTVAVAGVPALSSVLLDAESAAKYADLHELLRPYIEPAGRAIMAFDELPGLVLLLDGRPVGEAWYSAIDQDRTAASIRAECEASPPWWGDRSPILIFMRDVTETERAALRSCGLPLGTAYRLLAPREQTHGFQIYVPTDTPQGR